MRKNALDAEIAEMYGGDSKMDDSRPLSDDPWDKLFKDFDEIDLEQAMNRSSDENEGVEGNKLYRDYVATKNLQLRF